MKRGRVKAERAFKNEKRQIEHKADEPCPAGHQEQSKRPAAMSLEIASHRIAQGHGGTHPDQNRAEAGTDVLRDVADASADPGHIKTGHAEGDRGQHVKASVPAMKDRKAVTDLWNQLERSGEHDDDGRTNMQRDGEIAHGVAGDVTVSNEFAPAVEIAAQRGDTVERRNGKCEERTGR